MLFLFNLFNHNKQGQRSLEDVIGIIGKQLRDLGHEAVWQYTNHEFLMSGSGYNVIVEGFTDAVVEVVARAHSQGARFICIATEEPTEKGFNHGTSPEMVARQEAFHKAAPYLDAIWHLVPGDHVNSFFSQFAPTAYVELGFAKSLVRPQFIREPKFDFGFYGSASKRRMTILKRLAKMTNKHNAIRVVADFATQDERDKAMQDAKVILQIRKFDEMGLVSSSRCCTALCLGRPVIAEPHLLSHPWDTVVKFAKSLDEFYTMALMARPLWRGMYNDQMTKFMEKLSPINCLGEALTTIDPQRQKAA